MDITPIINYKCIELSKSMIKYPGVIVGIYDDIYYILYLDKSNYFVDIILKELSINQYISYEINSDIYGDFIENIKEFNGYVYYKQLEKVIKGGKDIISIKFYDILFKELINLFIDLSIGNIHFINNIYTIDIYIRKISRLVKIGTMSRECYRSIVQQIKCICDLDYLDTTSIKSGSTIINYIGAYVTLRSSIHPVIFGEDMTLRFIFNGNSETLHNIIPSIDIDRFSKVGLHLICGLTNSGKTTFANRVLLEIKDGKKIMTVEDPVEMIINGISQSSIDSVSHGDYIKSAMRNNPDILFVGEIRDTVTAQLCISAALTGHCVISTIHTDDAIKCIQRMDNLGVPLKDILYCLENIVLCRNIDGEFIRSIYVSKSSTNIDIQLVS